MNFSTYLPLYLLGVSSLFPILNPVGTAFIVRPLLSRTHSSERKSEVLKIIFYSLILGISTLFLGSWVLKFMGIEIATTQLAGGLLITRISLALLNSESETQKDAESADLIQKSLFYPLTFPLTLGPGSISTLITLSAHANAPTTADTIMHMGILSVSLATVLAMSLFCYYYSEALIERIGTSGSQVLNRLMAFLLFCIGIQMTISGLGHSFPNLFH